MATGPTSFPTTLDSFPTILSTTNEDDAGFEHDLIHDWEMTAIAALQAKVGVDGSADTNSLDYKVAHASSGHGSTTTTAAPTASGGNWVLTVADTTAFNAVGLPIYCSDGTNTIHGHVVSVASSTQLTVAPDSTSGTISAITNGSTFTFSGVQGPTGQSGAGGGSSYIYFA